MHKTVTLALTGASGLAYGLRLLECLLAQEVQVRLLVSQAAHVVAAQELHLTLPARPAELEAWLRERYPNHPGSLCVYGREDWFAPVASGSGASEAMVVCPCSMGTLAAIAQGLSDNLIERAADVIARLLVGLAEQRDHGGVALAALDQARFFATSVSILAVSRSR